jgi:hypothetical protein
MRLRLEPWRRCPDGHRVVSGSADGPFVSITAMHCPEPRLPSWDDVPMRPRSTTYCWGETLHFQRRSPEPPATMQHADRVAPLRQLSFLN